MLDFPVNGPIVSVRLRVNAALSWLGLRLLGVRQQQIVVCGFPRGGTSLLYNMISSCLPEFHCEPFEQYFIYRIHRLGNYATKAPLDVLHVPWIDGLNINRKELAVLVVVRDIRDVLTSRHPVLPNEYFIGHDHSWWPQDKTFKKWHYDAPGVIHIYEAVRAIRTRSDTTIVRYEDLVADPNAVQRTLAELYGLRFDGDFQQFHERPERHAYKYEGRFAPVDASLVRESLQSTTERVARWRKRPEDVQRIIAQFSQCEMLFTILEEFGYEVDREWFQNLD